MHGNGKTYLLVSAVGSGIEQAAQQLHRGASDTGTINIDRGNPADLHRSGHALVATDDDVFGNGDVARGERKHQPEREWVGEQGMNLMSSTLLTEDTGVPFGDLQAEQIAIYRQADADADTVLVTIPNQLGVDYNSHLLETIVQQIAPDLGWR